MQTEPPFKRILVIPLRYIGDTILTVPLIRNLKAACPQAEIDVLTSRVAAPLLEPCPYLHRIFIEPKTTGDKLSLLHQGKYDAVFILRKSATMALLCRLAGIPNVIGYDKQRFPWGYKRWGWFLSKAARYPSLKTETPQAVSHLGLLKAAGLPMQGSEPEDTGLPVRDSARKAPGHPGQGSELELWSTAQDEERVDVLLAEAGIGAQDAMAVLHAASASHGKQIDPSKFVDSLQALSAAGYCLLATGTAADTAIYDHLARQANVPLVNLAGKTSLRETYALYKRIRLLLTVDSSPIHMGAAASVPNIVGVFGPTNEKQWGPHNPAVQFNPVFIDLPCRPCYAKICEHNNCRVQITGAQIRNALPD